MVDKGEAQKGPGGRSECEPSAKARDGQST